MKPWLLLFASVVAAQEFYYDKHWNGPAKGCRGVPEANKFNVECTLPSGNLTLTVNRPGTWMKITCEDNSTFSCEELQEARPHVAKYVTPVNVATNGSLDSFEIKNCILPAERLNCPLSFVGRDETVLLQLAYVKGVLEPVHVEGMKSTEKFRIYYKRGANITRVPYEVLAELPALRSFTMTRGQLVLNPEAKGTPLLRLKKLELPDGNLQTIPRGAFMNVPHLESLLLWNNHIESVDEDAFIGLAHLQNVSLNSNQLSSMPNGLFRHCTQLSRIDLYNNDIHGLPSTLFQGLEHLRDILLFENRVTLHLEDGVFSNLPSLRQLKLGKNMIRSLPEDLFQNSSNLQELYLSGNEIDSLPPEIFRDPKLRVLRLDNNKLEHLPPEVLSTQTVLEILDLSGNALKEVSEGLFYHTKHLKVLNLNNNKLEKIQKSLFISLKKLEELHLSGNRIQHLDSAAFEVMHNSLTILSLARNNLTISRTMNTSPFKSVDMTEYKVLGSDYAGDATQYISPFSGLMEIRELYLSRNRISMMCDDWKYFPQLKKLDLSYNNFTYIHTSDLDFPRNLDLDLSYNAITYFQVYTYLDSTINIPKVLLNHNPYFCDCNMFQFLDTRSKRNIFTNVDIEQAACNQPPSLKGVPLSRLSPDQVTCNATDCPDSCSCVIHPSKSYVVIDCQNTPTDIPKNEGLETRLRLRQISDLRRLPPNVKYIDLSSLNLTEAPQIAANSVEIDLSKNRLQNIPIELLKRKCELHLSDNPIDCSCGKKQDLEFLKANQHLLKNYQNLTCDDRLLISGIDIDRLCTARDSTIIGGTIALMGIFIAVLTATAYKYNTEIRILLRKFGIWCGEDELENIMYDAFVSFAHEDELFVMEELVPRLESGYPSLRLCIHYRDWVVGDYIPAQIVRSVENSRKTILVLSKHFLRSVWAQMEFRAAHANQTLVVLVLDDSTLDVMDPELKAYIKVNTYVKRDDPLVWDRLKDAVLSKRQPLIQTNKQTDKAVGLDVHLNKHGELVNRALTAPSV